MLLFPLIMTTRTLLMITTEYQCRCCHTYNLQKMGDQIVDIGEWNNDLIQVSTNYFFIRIFIAWPCYYHASYDEKGSSIFFIILLKKEEKNIYCTGCNIHIKEETDTFHLPVNLFHIILYIYIRFISISTVCTRWIIILVSPQHVYYYLHF